MCSQGIAFDITAAYIQIACSIVEKSGRLPLSNLYVQSTTCYDRNKKGYTIACLKKESKG